MYDGGAQLSFNIILSGTFEIGLRNIVRYCTKCDPLYKYGCQKAFFIVGSVRGVRVPDTAITSSSTFSRSSVCCTTCKASHSS